MFSENQHFRQISMKTNFRFIILNLIEIRIEKPIIISTVSQVHMRMTYESSIVNEKSLVILMIFE